MEVSGGFLGCKQQREENTDPGESRTFPPNWQISWSRAGMWGMRKNTPFVQASAMQPSGGKSFPASDLAFCKPIFPCAFFSGGVLFFRRRFKTPLPQVIGASGGVYALLAYMTCLMPHQTALTANELVNTSTHKQTNQQQQTHKHINKYIPNDNNTDGAHCSESNLYSLGNVVTNDCKHDGSDATFKTEYFSRTPSCYYSEW